MMFVIAVIILFHSVIGQECLNGEPCYSITSITSESSIVKEELETLKKEVSYTALDEVLRNLAQSALTASNDVSKYGHSSTVQSSVKSLYNKVVSLHDAVTLAGMEFSSVADQSMTLVKESYSLVSSGQTVGKNIDQVIQGVAKLQGESRKLQNMADKHTSEADSVLQQLFKAKSDYSKEHKNHDKLAQDLKAIKASVEKSKHEAALAAQKAQGFAKQAEEAKHKAKKKIKKKKKGLFGLAGIFYEVVDDVFGIELLKKHEKQEKEARREQAKHEDNARKQQEKYASAEKELNSLRSKITKIKSDMDQIELMIASVQKVIGSCKTVATSMLNLKNFWDNMNVYCKQFKSDVALKELEMSEGHEGAAVADTEVLKARVERFYARWFALKLETDDWLEKRKDQFPVDRNARIHTEL